MGMNTTSRTVIATVEGVRHEIPEIWLVGYCRNGRHVPDAVAYWHYQYQLGLQFDAQQTEAAA